MKGLKQKPTQKQLKAIENLSKALNITVEKPKTLGNAGMLIGKLIKGMERKMVFIAQNIEEEYGNEDIY